MKNAVSLHPYLGIYSQWIIIPISFQIQVKPTLGNCYLPGSIPILP